MASRRQLKCLVSLVCRGRRPFSMVPESSASSFPVSEKLIDMEKDHSAHKFSDVLACSYHPIPVVFSEAKGSSIWDPEGKRYLDFLSAYSAVNQGHCHPKIVKAFQEQAEKLTLSSRAFYNDKFPLFADYLTQFFGYDMVLPMNTGAEGVETALKLARKWGYKKKRIPKDEAIIVSCCGCFHGRTLGVISMSCDNEATREFGPLLPGHLKVDFGDAVALEKIFIEHGDRIAGFLFEPIQGEAGILGKALGGGVIPVSAVLADKEVMLCIQPGEHGSTFGGNPLASAVAIASLEVIKDERLAERSAKLGEELRNQLIKIQEKFPQYIKNVRGRGLFNAVELKGKALSPVSAYDICMKLKERGVLAKPTHDTIIRLTPPLSISLDELKEGSKALNDVLEIDLPKLMKEKPHTASSSDSNICDRCGRNLYASED
ncbi:ornithine aminotransferase [Cucumis melo var. makuwa]|uniref:Ornithine aminotransferase n=1 Tax=Cucumis melo var. makuwa TaxID=1194695 RepID=A0A5D3DAX3_CUCMM|nr:ornithine aminotransferase [Cucumis melo var. makuwa]